MMSLASRKSTAGHRLRRTDGSPWGRKLGGDKPTARRGRGVLARSERQALHQGTVDWAVVPTPAGGGRERRETVGGDECAPDIGPCAGERGGPIVLLDHAGDSRDQG